MTSNNTKQVQEGEILANFTLSNVREKIRQNSEDRSRDFQKSKEKALQKKLVEMSSSETEMELNDSKANFSVKSHNSKSFSSSEKREDLRTRLVELSEMYPDIRNKPDIRNPDIRNKVVPENPKCKICRKSFSTWSKMMDHDNAVHNITKILCFYCGIYIHKDKLTKHFKDVHEEKQNHDKIEKVISRFFLIFPFLFAIF